MSRFCLDVIKIEFETCETSPSSDSAATSGTRAGAWRERMRAIERGQGRRRQGSTRRNAPRVLDLDLLLFGRRRLSRPRLSLPHPRMHERAFVLRPLIDIAPATSIPGRGAARTWLRRAR